MNKWKELGLNELLVKVIDEMEFDTPSEVQNQAIPITLAGKDLIAGSATGSGKTLAFGANIIQNSVEGKGVQALILTPTRELADQIADSLRGFSKYKPLNFCTVYGGVPIDKQIDDLMSADVVVGTPGRILDHMERKTIRFDEVKFLVLDEADRMLDMGFSDDVDKIISAVPKERQTVLFSATISSDMIYLAEKYMNKPEEVSIERYVDPSKLTQVYYDVPDGLKFSLLVLLLKKEDSKLVMLFCNTRRNVDFVATNLANNGIEALPIHGGYTQDKRTKILKKFNSSKTQVLVCTDVAARGLDIGGVSHVYNYDIPKDATEYIHRIGRTARAGKEGKVINILASRDYENFSEVQNHNREMKMTLEKTPYIHRVEIKMVDDPKRGGRPQGNRDGGQGRSHQGGRSFGGNNNRR